MAIDLRTDTALVTGLQRHLQPLAGTPHDYDSLLGAAAARDEPPGGRGFAGARPGT